MRCKRRIPVTVVIRFEGGILGFEDMYRIIDEYLGVRRGAPRELIHAYPMLWYRLSRQRYAWLQVPWLLLLSAHLLLGEWLLAPVFAAVWVWQRSRPSLIVCALVEFLILIWFVISVFGLKVMIAHSPAEAFAMMAAFGVIVFAYQAGGRSWHYLFQYMCHSSDAFFHEARERNWVGPVKPRSRSRRRWSIPVAGFGLVAAVTVMWVLD